MRRPAGGRLEPLAPKRKWQAITVATLLLVPGWWSLLAGLVGAATGGGDGAPDPAAALALGAALVPFAFVALAFLTEQPRPPTAVLRAMGAALLVGIPVSALAGDAVTGMVAGLGAGGACAIRADAGHSTRARVAAVAFAAAYTFVLVRVASAMVLLPAPVFPFTAVGLADHLSERRTRQEASVT